MNAVAIVAHSDFDAPRNDTGWELLLMATVLMSHGVRLAIDAPPSLLLPVAAAARSHAVLPAIESFEEADVPPLTIMRQRYDGSLEDGMFKDVELGFEDGERRTSLVDQFAAIGQLSRAEGTDDMSGFAYVDKRLNIRAIVAIGWSTEMYEMMLSAENFGQQMEIPLLTAGSDDRTGAGRSEWRRLDQFLEAEEVKIEPLRDETEEFVDRPEEYFAAWSQAVGEAAIAIHAQLLAEKIMGLVDRSE